MRKFCRYPITIIESLSEPNSVINNMQTFTPDDLEEDILADLMEEINELYESSEQTLIELELRPEDNELQRALFRSIHTIKGDLGLVNFSPSLKMSWPMVKPTMMIAFIISSS